MAEAKKPQKKKAYKVNKIYTVSGQMLTNKNKSCPKCGDGFFMANHKNRITCGKCGYTEKK